MTEKNFLNIHVLMSHSPSCLNRDDMNMQKSAFFGGVKRVRISSQSLKRAMRKSAYYEEHLGSPSVRTRNLEKLKASFSEKLKDEFPAEIVSETIDRFVKSSKKEETDDDQTDDLQEQPEEVSKKIAVAPWVLAEIRELCRVVQTVRDQGLSEEELTEAEKKFEKKKGKKKKDKQSFIDQIIDKKINDLRDTDALRRALSSAVDICLSGRMATSGLMTTIDGALSVAHAITTHVADADIDWFTAVDDLTSDLGELGAGHLNTQEFSAGVFYRYASLNIGQLAENLGCGRQRVLEIGKHVVRMMATITPDAKQRSFAAYNPADFVVVSFGDMPISLANAFEEPVKRDWKNSGFIDPSIKALTEYWAKTYEGYGLKDAKACFSLRKTDFSPCLKTFTELEQWVEQDGKGDS